MLRRALCAVVVVLAATLVASPATAGPCWQPPVDGLISDPFRAPPCPYCAGNRGIEYRVAPNSIVRAVASGTVSWAGSIAGTRYVVVRHVNGWRTTYGRLASMSLSSGDAVLAGSRIGETTSEFYFGLRQGDRYVDPAPYLGHLRGRPRLVPIDGRAARPSPPPRWRCVVGVAAGSAR